MAESFPLDWLLGYKRTKSRTWSKFKQTPDAAQKFLSAELSRLGARSIVLSTNIPVRRDGMMYVDYMTKKIDDPGVAVYFSYKGNDVVMCCDKYEKVWENIFALGKGIEAIRGMERWGVSEFMERAFTGFKAIPENITMNGHTWYEILGVDQKADEQDIKAAYRKLAQVHHPDTGGSSDMFTKISTAYQQGIKQLNS